MMVGDGGWWCGDGAAVMGRRIGVMDKAGRNWSMVLEENGRDGGCGT